jgi:glutamine synthetase
VNDHADVLRASIASPGNDHRLGANEAPPAIISVFLGTLLGQILDQLEAGNVAGATESQIIDLGVSKIPNISKDYTDRNRTSPFAFTGNKFEFRAVGSSANVAVPMSILNAAVANTFKIASEKLRGLIKTKGTRDEAVIELIRDYVKETKNIRFEGNGYSEEWRKEAKKRGLPILNSSAEALEVLNDVKATSFLVEQKVLSKEEIASRYHINTERYVKTIEIELATLEELVTSYVIPAVETQLFKLHRAHSAISEGPTAITTLKKLHSERVAKLETVFSEILFEVKNLEVSIEKVSKLSDESQKMKCLAFESTVIASRLRDAADNAERLVADDLWPLPKYREMLLSNTLS